MIFTRLADFVTRRYKLIIVVWVVLLFYAFPLIFKINDVVVYTETEVGLNKLEAVQADNIIAEQFPGRIANSTITIVMQNSDVTSVQARDYSKALYDDMVAPGALAGVTRVDYLYGALEAYVSEVARQMAPAERLLYSQVDQTANLVYGIPLQIVSMHLALLMQPGMNDTQAQMIVLQNITAQLASSGADQTTVLMTLGYANEFYVLWLPTHAQDGSSLENLSRAAVYNFFSPLPGEAGLFPQAVVYGLTVADFTVTAAKEALTFNMIAGQSGASQSFVETVWNLGPSPTASSLFTLAEEVVFGGPLDALPVEVPQAIIGQFVNIASGQPGTTMLMAVQLGVSGSSAEAEHDVRAIRDLVRAHSSSLGSGFAVYVSGDPAINVDTMDAVAKDTSKIDPATVILVILLVGLFFRSAVTPWVPLATIGMAYLMTTAAVYVLGLLVMHIHYSVMTFVLVVMLGAGTDYCIFVMSRYREERVLGRTKEESVKTSLEWAGESIATSGATVMIGFGALMIGEYSLVKSMGMALAVAVGMALLFSLTMLPSMLMLFGDKMFWPSRMDREARRAEELEKRGGGYFRKSARFSMKHAKVIVLVALVAAVPAAYLVLTMHPSYDFIASLPNAESKLGIDALGEGFGKGNLMPTYIVVRFDNPVFSNSSLTASSWSQLEDYSRSLAAMENIRSVSGPTRPFGTTTNATFIDALPADQKATYLMAIAGAVGTDNRTIRLTVILQDEPFTLNSIQTIDRVREFDADAERTVFADQAAVLVGGSTASMADVSRTVSNDFVTMRFLVILGIYLVLLFVLGSLIIPLRLIGTVLLNVSITISMTMIVFIYMSGTPVLWLLPLILFVVAMGLGMDYDIFLTTRIREEVSKGKTDEEAIKTAVEKTGGIITACGMIMGGAFGTMLLSGTKLLQEFGFGLAFAILLDAMILRIYLVPAIMLLLQKWNWYAPGRLQRVRRADKRREKPRNH